MKNYTITKFEAGYMVQEGSILDRGSEPKRWAFSTLGEALAFIGEKMEVTHHGV